MIVSRNDNKPIEIIILAVLTLLETIISNFVITSSYTTKYTNYIFFTFSMVSVLILVGCYLKSDLKKPLLFRFLLLESFPSIAIAVHDKYQSNATIDVEFILLEILFLLPFLLLMVVLFFKNKIIEWISLSSMIFYIFIVVFAMIKENDLWVIIYCVIYLARLVNIIYIWYSLIYHHITFKEKIKFDYKPIKKKVAVTETTLEELKLMYDNGTITESEYNRRKSEIINTL